MKISDLKKVLNDIEEKYGDIEVTTYDEGGYTIDSEYVRVFEMNQKIEHVEIMVVVVVVKIIGFIEVINC